MGKEQRKQLEDISHEVLNWVDQAISLLGHREEVVRAAEHAVDSLRRSIIDIQRPSALAWRVLPLRTEDGATLGAIARGTKQQPLKKDERLILDQLLADIPQALTGVKSISGARRFFSGSAKRAAGQGSAKLLTEFRERADSIGLARILNRLDTRRESSVVVSPTDALADWVGLRTRVAHLGGTPKLFANALIADLSHSVSTIDKALKDEARFRSDALKAGNAVRSLEVRRLLSETPVEGLKDATRDRVRVGPLTDAGIKTVQAVLDRGDDLQLLPGIGATTAIRMRGAAQTLWQTTYDEMPVRLDVKRRTQEATALLKGLRVWDATRATKTATTDLAHAATLRPLVQALDGRVSQLLVFPVASTIKDFSVALDAVRRRARFVSGTNETGRPDDPWQDFLARPADYFTLLAELGFITEDEAKTRGELPDEIVEAVRALELNTQHLAASLRGYQSFGARFALVQRKVIIGDEMGLGKTVEALAVLAHLRAKGHHYFLVVCPAAVVTNWMREVASKSSLRPHRVHGPARDVSTRNWIRSGGVAVTTYETLGWLQEGSMLKSDLGCVIVDEAHYIKNPAALRAQRVTRVLDSCERAVLLTGTPLENRIAEFATLVGYIRPDLVIDADELTPRRFRKQVAPAYLRRNQEDVLTELPELVEVDEWLPMSAADTAAYRSAVAAGNFMAMRQAAMQETKESEKLQRLVQIVAEAEDNGRRVIVFSHFREVLNNVARALPGKVFGPLTGSVQASARQLMVDRFSAAGHGAVLVSQIQAGGVGLNIQAASVVVICEPQLKPTTEWQAIARARRMGQLESVQVHRLLSEEGVDQRITEILARKREIFNDFARISETADSAPEALDVSEADLAREVIAAERERLFGRFPTN